MVQVEQEIQEVESWDPGGGGKLVPGIYEAKILAVEVKESQSGHPKLSFKYQVVDGESIGCLCFGDRSLHPNALPYFRGMMDVLNCFATGRAFDEQKLVGRFLKVQVIEYDKQDQTKGLKVEKQFRSDTHVNDQLDITATSGGGARAPEKAKTGGNGNGSGNKAPAGKVDDLPF
jgi:hypothetical protein